MVSLIDERVYSRTTRESTFKNRNQNLPLYPIARIYFGYTGKFSAGLHQ